MTNAMKKTLYQLDHIDRPWQYAKLSV